MPTIHRGVWQGLCHDLWLLKKLLSGALQLNTRRKKTFFKACHCGVKNSYFFISPRNKSHIQKLLLVVNERTRWVSLAKQLRGYKNLVILSL